MKGSKCTFSPEWLDPILHPDWNEWLSEGTNKTSAKCSLCRKEFNLSNMGIQAVKSHIQSKKHQGQIKAKKNTHNMIASFVQTQSPKIANCPKSDEALEPGPSEIKKFSELPLAKYANKDVPKAEILWILTAASCHLSTRSADRCQQNFSKIFHDSQIAKKFSVGKDKHRYTTVFGLAPHFKTKLVSEINTAKYISISFDESLNKVAHRTQMDLHIRFYDSTTKRIITRYLTSQFMSSTKAEDILENLKEGIGTLLDIKKIISLSMDGPHVNWKALSLFKNELEIIPDSSKLVEFGSCTLHVIHGSLKTGHNTAGWKIIEYLRSTFYLFNDFPSRRGGFTSITGSQQFPAKFCTTRWVENHNAATIAIRLLPHMRKYVDEVKEIKNSKVFTKVKMFLQDKMLGAKLGFFQGVSHQLEEFLTKFQRDVPMVPFLFDDLHLLLNGLMKRIIKKHIFEKHSPLKIDFSKSENFRLPEEIELYHSAKDGIRNAAKRPSNAEILTFKKECLSFLKSVIAKLLERCPLRYPITKGLSCISPKVMLKKNLVPIDKCISHFIDLNRFTGIEGDIIKEEHEKVVGSPVVIEMLHNFDSNKDRLDDLFNSIYKHVNVKDIYKDFVLVILTLFHGNASVECGFSVNKYCLDENLREESLVARRIVYDEIIAAGGPEFIDISPQLLLCCRNASSRYKDDLEKKKKLEKKNSATAALKRKAITEIKEIEAKRRSV